MATPRMDIQCLLGPPAGLKQRAEVGAGRDLGDGSTL